MSRFSLIPFWRYPLLFCLFSGVLLLLASCSQNTTAGQTSTQAGGTSTQGCDIEVSWAVGYGSLKELKQARVLDLTVQGTFTAIQSTQGQASPSGQNNLLSTDFTFLISKVLLDPHHFLKDSYSKITIHQTGGSIGNTLHQVCGDPLFGIGEEAILFLQQLSPGHYFVMGGPSGRFDVRKGLVQPINDEGVKLPQGATEQQFYTLLSAA
ncbi:hypothetical protein KDA_47130 [Dictyobacter alpinus]|uniref:Lipid/polyisoprenoid-binding YceI-like domain-containing protein n=1 Tax=Dictyobacter alpinus TaxID=2014873 RepID=A0A402BCZ8_9CHLR|nr:hypothetical protein [Dictyobacter alpinus]GCE29229.1 hypothetical protein KDA_47130 [Dictyobacter alpinus]